jgi:periplasmic protein TonB
VTVRDSLSAAETQTVQWPDRGLVAAVTVSLIVHALVLGAACMMSITTSTAPARTKAWDGVLEVHLDQLAPVAPAKPANAPAAPALTPVATVRNIPAPSRVITHADLAAEPPQPRTTALAAAAPVGAGTTPMAPAVPVDPAVGNDYRRQLLLHIASYRRELGPGAVSGRTTFVHFSVTRAGLVSEVFVSGSSGDAGLDDEAVATIWRARPMPQIPTSLPDQLSVTLPVTFSDRARIGG